MTDRTCIKCNRTMIPVKNGFFHVGPDGEIRSGDLWGCKPCGRFQLHGIPTGHGSWMPLYGWVNGERVKDPNADEFFRAYLDPDILFCPPFFRHMKEWYSDFVFVVGDGEKYGRVE